MLYPAPWFCVVFTSLTCLRYKYVCGAGSEGCEHISEMLKANKAVKKVILSSNMIDDDGIRAVADGLAVNAVVSTLLVAGNPFGDIGVRQLRHYFWAISSRISLLYTTPTRAALYALLGDRACWILTGLSGTWNPML